MVRLLIATDRQLRISFVIWVWLICLIAASPVEERLQALEATNVEIKQVLAAKSERIEKLENEVQQLKSTVTELKTEREAFKKTRQKREINGAVNSIQSVRRHAILRTCHETRLADPTLPSGIFWIDPDGQGVGEDPIGVYCDMNTGTTSILHDSESPTNVGHCANPGCYTKRINYSATKRQIVALIELSNECHQSFRYNCNNAPFEVNGIAYSWWNDRNGNQQHFWAGNKAGNHTCQCGIDGNCTESALNCNCDSSRPVSQFDSGIITNKDLLPVTRLNFGRTLETSSGVYTLGSFECSGQVAVKGMPSSCTDLWRIGHTLNGLYSVVGTKMVESVYCNFTKLPHETGFETRVGFVDVKSSLVYFYVRKNKSFAVKNTPIPFEVAQVNIGESMNIATGIFTAPRSGVYFFTFSALARLTSYWKMNHFGVSLMLNGNDLLGKSNVLKEGGQHDYYPISFQSALNMKAGDKVWVEIRDMDHTNLYDDKTHNTLFTGQLLHENISQLLS